MSNIGTGIPNRPNISAETDARAHHQSTAAESRAPRTPYLLLWSTGIAAVVIGIAAFILWGVTGVSTLFDMIVALCT